MGYTATAPLRELWPEELPEQVAIEAARRVGVLIEDEATERTPTAETPLAYFFAGGTVAWIKDRKGRQPGTMRGSWETLPMEIEPGPAVRVTVHNTDEKTIYVEEDTRPHLIKAKKAEFLRFPMGPRFLYRRQVSHPGTQGVHMMRDALAVADVNWPRIVQQVFEEMA